MKKIKELPPVIWMFAIIIIVFSITGKNFFSLNNIINIIKQASPFLIVALGETMVILIGGTDLSIGYVMGFSGVSVK